MRASLGFFDRDAPKEHFRNAGEVPKKTGGQGRGGREGETWTNGRGGKYTWQQKSTAVLGVGIFYCVRTAGNGQNCQNGNSWRLQQVSRPI